MRRSPTDGATAASMLSVPTPDWRRVSVTVGFCGPRIAGTPTWVRGSGLRAGGCRPMSGIRVAGPAARSGNCRPAAGAREDGGVEGDRSSEVSGTGARPGAASIGDVLIGSAPRSRDVLAPGVCVGRGAAGGNDGGAGADRSRSELGGTAGVGAGAARSSDVSAGSGRSADRDDGAGAGAERSCRSLPGADAGDRRPGSDDAERRCGRGAAVVVVEGWAVAREGSGRELSGRAVFVRAELARALVRPATKSAMAGLGLLTGRVRRRRNVRSERRGARSGASASIGVIGRTG